MYGEEQAMHKTQVVLEDWQYEALRMLAAQEQRSISALVREMLTQHLTEHHATAWQRLAAMEGIGADTHATGQEHDTFLYGTQSDS
jgi:plasmid stability protein